MSAIEYVMTSTQMTSLQKWIISHDLTVKYIAVIMTLSFTLEILRAMGVLHY